MVKNSSAKQGTWVQSLGPKIPWRRKWQPTPVFLPGGPHGQRSLAPYSPQRLKESWTRLSDSFTLSLDKSDLGPKFDISLHHSH